MKEYVLFSKFNEMEAVCGTWHQQILGTSTIQFSKSQIEGKLVNFSFRWLTLVQLSTHTVHKSIAKKVDSIRQPSRGQFIMPLLAMCVVKVRAHIHEHATQPSRHRALNLAPHIKYGAVVQLVKTRRCGQFHSDVISSDNSVETPVRIRAAPFLFCSWFLIFPVQNA